MRRNAAAFSILGGAKVSRRAETTPLVDYALRGLQRCWLSETRRYSHRFRFDVEPQNESVPASDLLYTLNVMLGLSRLSRETTARVHGDVAATYARCCDAVTETDRPVRARGLAVWAGAVLNLSPPGRLLDQVRSLATDRRALMAMTAQDAAMLASGAVELAAAEGADWRGIADKFAAHLRDRYYDRNTRLFYNQPSGPRRRFSSFASQVYPLLALYRYAETRGTDWASRLANEVAARLITLQGSRGEWPWFYYVPQGRAVDFYEVYSVHQHGMAPAFLHSAAEHGVVDARHALRKGFDWLFGDNEMHVSMLRKDVSMFYRSQARAGELGTRWRRVGRSIANSLLHCSDAPERHHGLVLRPECRSYELGWLLWSFGGRSDYPELTQHREFIV
jgi:hypothetical protein